MPDALSWAPVGVLVVRGSQQLTNATIHEHQQRSQLRAQVARKGKDGSMKDKIGDGVLHVLIDGTWKVVLPATLWSRVFRVS